MSANEEIVVANPAEPLVSEVYSRQGQQLDNIILMQEFNILLDKLTKLV
ncbi:hypothetical protein [Gracilibacillus boraciitolerans]|nr:hypothetical protein [Gracilibacillus boraciitolerans]